MALNDDHRQRPGRRRWWFCTGKEETMTETKTAGSALAGRSFGKPDVDDGVTAGATYGVPIAVLTCLVCQRTANATPPGQLPARGDVRILYDLATGAPREVCGRCIELIGERSHYADLMARKDTQINKLKAQRDAANKRLTETQHQLGRAQRAIGRLTLQLDEQRYGGAR